MKNRIAHLLEQIVSHFKKMHPYSLTVIKIGLQLTCGLYAMAGLFYFLIGRTGNMMATIILYRSALDTAPAVLIAACASAFICDIAIKDKQSKDENNT